MTCPFDKVAVVGAFSASEQGWRFSGALTVDDAASVLEASKGIPIPATGIVDFSDLTHADSAALAVIIALQRRARTEGRTITATGLAPTLHSLAVLYGVEALLA